MKFLYFFFVHLRWQHLDYQLWNKQKTHSNNHLDLVLENKGRQIAFIFEFMILERINFLKIDENLMCLEKHWYHGCNIRTKVSSIFESFINFICSVVFVSVQYSCEKNSNKQSLFWVENFEGWTLNCWKINFLKFLEFHRIFFMEFTKFKNNSGNKFLKSLKFLETLGIWRYSSMLARTRNVWVVSKVRDNFWFFPE